MKTVGFIIKQTIHDLNLEDKKRDANILLNGFWGEFSDKMKRLDEKTIFVRHVGTFPLSRYKIGQLISKSIRSIRKIEKRGKDASHIREKVKTLCLRRNQIAWEYYIIRVKRTTNALKRLDNRSKERDTEWR